MTVSPSKVKKVMNHLSTFEKQEMLEQYKNKMEVEAAWPWCMIEPRIKQDIEKAYDDAQFAKEQHYPEYKEFVDVVKKIYKDKPTVDEYLICLMCFTDAKRGLV